MRRYKLYGSHILYTGPVKTLLLYDGDCGFCTWSAQQAKRFDRAGRLDIMPLQAPGVLARYGISPTAAGLSLHVVTPDGRVHNGGASIRMALRALPWLWPAYYLWFIPGVPWLMDRLYYLMARHRHRLGRWLGLEACRLPQQPR